MRVVVIGGTGLIGSKLVNHLRERGHDVVAASPSSGVNTITGEGLAAVLKGTDVVVDLANSPAFDAKSAIEFFETSGRNLLAAEAKAGVKHHLALSVVGTDRYDQIGYFRAKLAQENLIRNAKIPYTIVRSTQFFDFLPGIVKGGTEGDVVRLSSAFVQPIAADDVGLAMLDYTLGDPVNGVVEIAGPERFRLSDLGQRYMTAMQDARKVVADAQAHYFGAPIKDDTLVPIKGIKEPRLGAVNFETWLARAKASK